MVEKKVFVTVTQEGWAGYNGPLGGYIFVDGKSVDQIPLRNALRIGATLEADDESGLRLHPSTYKLDFNPAHVAAVSHDFSDPVNAPLPAYVPETAAAEVADIDLEPTRTVSDTGVVKVAYSRAQLEAITDKRGLIGLREIGDPLSVKGRSVSELIDKILEAQG